MPETLWVDPAQVAVVDTDDPKPVLDVAGRAASAAEVSPPQGRFATIEGTADHKGRFCGCTAGDRAALSRGPARSHQGPEGFMSRHVERLIRLRLRGASSDRSYRTR
jgi:hypothetical protein